MQLHETMTPMDRIQDLAHQIIWLVDLNASTEQIRSYAEEILMQCDIVESERSDDA